MYILRYAIPYISGPIIHIHTTRDQDLKYKSSPQHQNTHIQISHNSHKSHFSHTISTIPHSHLVIAEFLGKKTRFNFTFRFFFCLLSYSHYIHFICNCTKLNKSGVNLRKTSHEKIMTPSILPSTPTIPYDGPRCATTTNDVTVLVRLLYRKTLNTADFLIFDMMTSPTHWQIRQN